MLYFVSTLKVIVQLEYLNSFGEKFECRTDLLGAFVIFGSLRLNEAIDVGSSSTGSSSAQLESTEHCIGTTKFLKKIY